MNENLKNTILENNISKSRSNNGVSMQVPMRKMRFPVIGGIQKKVTLKSKVTGEFMHIGFMAGIENTIHGNIADALLDNYPDIFDIIKINGKRRQQGKVEVENQMLMDSMINKLKEDYTLVPKKKEGKRERTAETEITNNKVPSDVKDKNIFTEKQKEGISEETKK